MRRSYSPHLGLTLGTRPAGVDCQPCTKGQALRPACSPAASGGSSLRGPQQGSSSLIGACSAIAEPPRKSCRISEPVSPIAEDPSARVSVALSPSQQGASACRDKIPPSCSFRASCAEEEQSQEESAGLAIRSCGESVCDSFIAPPKNNCMTPQKELAMLRP